MFEKLAQTFNCCCCFPAFIYYSICGKTVFRLVCLLLLLLLLLLCCCSYLAMLLRRGLNFTFENFYVKTLQRCDDSPSAHLCESRFLLNSGGATQFNDSTFLYKYGVRLRLFYFSFKIHTVGVTHSASGAVTSGVGFVRVRRDDSIRILKSRVQHFPNRMHQTCDFRSSHQTTHGQQWSHS